MIDSVDFWSIFRYPIIGELLERRQIRLSRLRGAFGRQGGAEKFHLFILYAPTMGYYEGAIEFALWPGAQEIDRSISSASYHVQCIAGVCVISGAPAE
jgi:hypothetical protein